MKFSVQVLIVRKTLRAILIAGLAAVGTPANALLTTTDCGFGAASCIVDDVANLEWLQPSLTADLSYNTVTTTLLGVDPLYDGFAPATPAQVDAFLLQKMNSWLSIVADVSMR